MTVLRKHASRTGNFLNEVVLRNAFLDEQIIVILLKKIAIISAFTHDRTIRNINNDN